MCARTEESLLRVAADCEVQGANVHAEPVDVRDSDALSAWIDQIDKFAPVDLMIVNAGIFGGRADPDSFEPPETATDLIQTNLIAAMQTAYSIAGPMRKRGRGQIALISSLAAKLSLADAPSYSASKAGLSAFGAALREDLAKHGVRVALVHPGHIDTIQTRMHNGPLSGLISAEDAARQIVNGLARGRTDISVPVLPRLWVQFLSMLPWRARARLNRKDRFTVTGPSDPTS